jgi:hypothetical protein
MLKTLLVTTAIAGLTVGAAVAEGNPPAPASAPPAATSNAPAKSDMKTDAKAVPAPGSASFINAQKPDQFLASKFDGTDVMGPNNEKIGDISDILFDKAGKIEAYVVSVGGFLGIGSKHVALAPSAFEVIPGDKSKNESDKLRLSMTKDQLKQAANFEPYNPPRTTTGMGGAAPRPVAPQPR